MNKADLHIHTTYSDGVWTPSRVVKEALDLGIKAIAITDHDAIGGIGPAIKAAKGRDLEVVPGVELSSYLDDKDVHVVGLYIDTTSPALREHLEFFRNQRHLRGEKIVALLNDLGVGITMDEVLKVARKGSVGRPHVAEALVRRGAVRGFDDAFKQYLGKDRPAYVAKYRVSPVQATNIIHDSGGVSILAHPGISLGGDRDIKGIMAMGMDGIEVSHPKHDPGTARRFRELAISQGWLMSGGSDCHGEGRNSSLIGECSVEVVDLKAILDHRNSINESNVQRLDEK